MKFPILVLDMRYMLLLLFVFIITSTEASDSLQVSLKARAFGRRDTIDFTCAFRDFAAQKLSSATLNVWIEDISGNKRWKFRYPMLSGEVSASLVVGDNIPDGQYAINFLIQRGFFKVMGEILDHDKKDTSINYMMILKNKKGTYFDNARVTADGNFRLKSTLFVDSAFFVFSPVKKTKNNYLLVKIETPLDSFFMPALSATRFITVGKVSTVQANATNIPLSSPYVFSTEEPVDKSLLPGVTVTGIIKKKIDRFNEENSRGLFQRDDAIIFDGLDNDEIARSVSVFQFLQGKVPGLNIEKDSTGNDVAKWRNEVVEIYVDEFKMDVGDHLFVIPNDIAMIKVYRPPAQLSAFSGGAGAIALYTRKGEYATNRSQHNFIVRGYTALESIWK